MLVEPEYGTGISARQLGDGGILIELDDAEPTGWEDGARVCRSFAHVSLVPGALLGAAQTRIVVHPAADVPKIVTSRSRVRLLWLPRTEEPAVAAQREEAPRAPAPQPRPETRSPEKREARAEPARQTPPAPAPSVIEPVPAATAPVPEQLPPAPRPAPRTVEAPTAIVVGIDPPLRLQANIATEARSGPGRRHDIVRRLAASELVSVDARMGDWARLGGGGWVFAAYFSPPAGAREEFLATVNVDRVQVRSGPGEQHDLVAEIFRGESVAIDDINGAWAHVRNGGWVPRSSLSD